MNIRVLKLFVGYMIANKFHLTSMSVCLSVCLCLYVCLSVRPSVRLSVRPSVRSSVGLDHGQGSSFANFSAG